MSLPHECECRICGRKMNESPFLGQINYNDPKMTGTAVMDISNIGYWCIKHGTIPEVNCTKCVEELQAIKPPV